MSGHRDAGLKSWLCTCDGLWDEGIIEQAPTRGRAKALFVLDTGCDEYTAVRTRRLEWMDGLDPESDDAQMAAMRHGWKGYTVGCSPDTGRPWDHEWDPGTMTEADFRRFAGLTGAAYPDRYAPSRVRDAGVLA